jgi:DNA-binding transcriptional LysR family regulator
MTGFKRLPSLTAMRAFEAAARHCSFKLAANELFITSAAISRQIKQLEQHLEASLFIRHHRQVLLTSAGKHLFSATHSAFTLLNNAASDVCSKDMSHHLNLQTTSSFASLWLIPRLQRLKISHPSLQLNLLSVESNPVVTDNFEVAITLGLEEDPNYSADFLFCEEVFPVCTPEFLQRYPQVSNEANLTQLPLLDLDPNFWQAKWWIPMDWRSWLHHTNIDSLNVKVDMYFSHYPMLIDTALQGWGIALGWHHLVDDLLSSGRLVRPLSQSYQATQRRHYFVCRNDLIN